MKKLILLLSVAMVLSACTSSKRPTPPTGGTTTVQSDTVRYQSASFSALPDWQTQNFQSAMSSFLQGCLKLQNKPEWLSTCQAAQRVPNENAAIKQFFEQNFTPWQVTDSGRDQGTVTGYYEPALAGGLSQNDQAQYPIYGIPNDLVNMDLPASARGKGQISARKISNNRLQVADGGDITVNLADFTVDANTTILKGRLDGNRFVPYYTRAQITAGALNGKAPILAYARDPVELFFLHVQGSGRLQTRDGKFLRLGYADKNGYAYKSIGTYLVNKGDLTMGQASMQGIRAWVQLNPHRMDEVLGVNPSFIFFKVADSSQGGPIGSLGVPLTEGYSGAVDPRYITLGAPLFLSTTYPSSNQPLNRLIMAQDTGSAIKGGVRVDFFWGFGDDAGNTAGKMKQQGRVWTLLPKGVNPKK